MRKLFVVVLFILVVFFIASYMYGSTIEDSCVTIGGQKSCWKNYVVTLNSELCTKNPCTASPELQKYNSIVDAVAAGCDAARQESFSNIQMNAEIESALSQITRYEVEVRALCSDPGLILVKKYYD